MNRSMELLIAALAVGGAAAYFGYRLYRLVVDKRPSCCTDAPSDGACGPRSARCSGCAHAGIKPGAN